MRLLLLLVKVLSNILLDSGEAERIEDKRNVVLAFLQVYCPENIVSPENRRLYIIVISLPSWKETVG